MKVLICHERYEPDFGGGGEIIVHKTAKYLSKIGVTVDVICSGDPEISSFEGIPTRRLSMSRYRFNLAADEVTEMARSADVIQVFNYHACLPALTAGKRLNKPVVCGILGLFGDAWTDMRGPLIGRIIKAWERKLLCMDYSRVFFLSEFSREIGIQLGVNANRSFVASPGVDNKLFRPSPQKDDVVLFAAKFDPRKGIEELIAVARALPHVNFRVVGWGDHPCTAPLYTMTNVEMITFDRQEVLRHAFASARIFFFPSRAETYGMVLVEAMASGCAIISTVALDYEGIRVPPRDVETMIKAVDELWKNRDKSSSMGNANRAHAELITWERYAQTLLSNYQEII